MTVYVIDGDGNRQIATQAQVAEARSGLDAAPSSHTHTAAEVGAAAASHTLARGL